MGTRLEIHPLAIIFLVIIAVTQFGFMGAFFVIPLYAVARIVIRNILEDAK
jgi:predicted PurR-regulated permease PerM